jgi:NitT/TauT family transport system permease protein
LYPVIITVIALIWWEYSAWKAGSEFVFPSLESTFNAFCNLLGQSQTYTVLLNTLLRTLLSFIVSVLVAHVLAILSALFTPLRKLLSPVVNALRALPTMAVTLVLAIWAGPKVAPVIVSVLVILPTAFVSYVEGIDSIDKDVLSMAKIDGANKLIIALRFLLPLSALSSRKSISATLSLNLKLMVAAETLASTANSIGQSMMISSIYFETATLMALTILTIILSLIIQFVLYRLLLLITKKID